MPCFITKQVSIVMNQSKKVLVTLDDLPARPEAGRPHPVTSHVIGWSRPFTRIDFITLSPYMWKASNEQLDEPCECEKEPICALCYKCKEHCTCVDGGWRINKEGLEKAKDLGYAIYINGRMVNHAIDFNDAISATVQDVKNDWQRVIADRKKKFEEERRRKVEVERMIASWKDGLVPLLDVSAISNVQHVDTIRKGAMYHGDYEWTFSKITFTFNGEVHDGFYQHHNQHKPETTHLVPPVIGNVVKNDYVTRLSLSLSVKNKNELLDEFPGMIDRGIIYKSWTKQKLIDAIVNHVVHDWIDPRHPTHDTCDE